MGSLPGLGGEHHFANVGELDRVAEQVHQHLAEAGDVAEQAVGKRRIDEEGELEPLPRRRLGDQVEGRLDARPQIEGMPLQLQTAGVDLGEVEDVVDDAEQRLAARADDGGELALARRQIGVEQQAAHADHRVHRRADLVAHRRQERALGGVGLLGDARLLLEPLEQAGVGHRDRGLVREGLQDRGLLRVERPHLVADEVDVADPLVFVEQRHRREAAHVAHFGEALPELVARRGLEVVDEDRCAVVASAHHRADPIDGDLHASATRGWPPSLQTPPRRGRRRRTAA